MARNNLATERSEGRKHIGTYEFKRLVKRLRKAPRTFRSLNLLFWYKKGDRSQDLAHDIRSYLDGV